VHTSDGDRVAADVVVLNPDLPVAWRDLLPAAAVPRRLSRLTYSPSCIVLLAGSRRPPGDGQAHHTIHFGQAWRETFRDIIDRGRLQTDPSLLVTTPTISDPSLAPAGRSSYYVLVPTPNLSADIDWDVIGPRYRDEVVAHLATLGTTGSARRSRSSTSRRRPTGRAAAWWRARRSRRPTRCSRPGRSGRATSPSTTSSSPDREPSPVSAYPWC
jgi:phytoene dehydrogenase-like protein